MEGFKSLEEGQEVEFEVTEEVCKRTSKVSSQCRKNFNQNQNVDVSFYFMFMYIIYI